MAWLPCRVCGNPVNGVKQNDTKSFCCSKSSCIKLDNGKNSDEPKILIDEKSWNRKINYLTRGY